MREKTLNGARTAELWAKIKERSLPVKALTADEYAALPAAKKNSGLYFVKPTPQPPPAKLTVYLNGEELDWLTEEQVHEKIETAMGGITGGLTEEEADARYLKLTGGHVTGALKLGANASVASFYAERASVAGSSLDYLEVGLGGADIMTFSRMDDAISASFSFGVEMMNNRVYGLPSPIYDSDAATKGYVDGLIGDISALLDEINGEVV